MGVCSYTSPVENNVELGTWNVERRVGARRYIDRL